MSLATGDIGLMGTPVKLDTGEKVEGYNIVLGGGKKGERIATLEKIKLLSVTGGVPRYLEDNRSLANGRTKYSPPLLQPRRPSFPRVR